MVEIEKGDDTDSKIAVFVHEDVAGFLGKEVLKDGGIEELKNARDPDGRRPPSEHT